MSEPVTIEDGLRVYQASGEVVVIFPGGGFSCAHYGVYGSRVDAAAQESLSPIEREADRLRGVLPEFPE